MAQTLQRAFNAGEVCEDAWSRDDIAQTARGFRLGRNMRCLMQGPVEKRRGFWHAGSAKTTAVPFVLRHFTRRSRQSLVIEFGNLYARVWGLDRVQVSMADIVTPFSTSDLPLLRFRQSGDVLYIFRRSGARPYVLQRHGATTWTCDAWSPRTGPWLPDFEDDGLSLTYDGSHLTASGSLFDALHAGALFRVKPALGYPATMDTWRAEWNPVNVQKAGYRANYYVSDDTDKKCGSSPPIHLSGTQCDGNGDHDYGVNWTYLHSGRTVFSVTGYTSATVISVSPVSGTEGAVCLGNPETSGWWSEGAYSDFRGWPSMAPAIHQKRFVTGCTHNNPSTLDLSQIQGWGPTYADYGDGKADATSVPDDAVRMEVTGSGAELHWAESFGELVVGADDGVWRVNSGSTNRAVTPTDNDSVLAGAVGADPCPPAVTPESLVYAGINGTVLCALSRDGDGYDFDDNIALIFAHLTDRKVTQVLFLRAPWSMLVLVLADGGFAFVTYSRKQGVTAATTQAIAGCTVLTAAVVEGSDGIDQLWLGLARGDQRLIAVMAGPNEAMYLDLAEAYDGSAVSTLSGLDHLAAATVSVLGDGRWFKDLTVSGGGAVTLPTGYDAAHAVAGLPIDMRFEDMPNGAIQRSVADMNLQVKALELTMHGANYRVGSCDSKEGDSLTDPFTAYDALQKPEVRHETTRSVISGWKAFDKRVFVSDVSPFPFKLFAIAGEVS